jgi:predicted RNA methylase
LLKIFYDPLMCRIKINLPAGTAVLGSAGATAAGACRAYSTSISPGALEAESRQKLSYGTASALGTLFR